MKDLLKKNSDETKILFCDHFYFLFISMILTVQSDIV